MSLKKNILGLAISQVFTYIIPLLQLPYLTRILGENYFGIVMYSLSVIMASQVITDYGFDLSLTKFITDKKRSKRKIGSLLYQTLILKFFLCFLAILISLIILKSSELKNNDEYIYLTLIVILVNSFNTLWLFQSIEKIYIYSRITIFSKLLLLLIVMIFIKDEKSYFMYPIALITSSLISIILCYIIIYKLGFRPIRVKYKNILILARISFQYFIARAGNSIFTIGSTIFLGSFGTFNQIALYSAAERLYAAGMGVFTPVTNPLIPYLNRTKNYKLFYKIVIILTIILILGTLLGLIFGNYILLIIFGENYITAKPTLNIFMLTLFVGALGLIFGYPALTPINKQYHANISVIIGGVTQLFLLYIMIVLNINKDAFNVAITYFLSNLISTSYRVYIFIKYINISNNKQNDF